VPSGEAPQVLRVVLDTNVAVSGLLSTQGAAHALLNLAVHHRARLRLGTSEENRDELLATLRESRLASRIVEKGFTPEALYLFYTTLTDPPVPTTLWKGHWSADPDDDAFLATVFAFGANLLVSRDRDLLNVKYFYGCQIVSPVQALALCRQAVSSRP
jgi:putative PIN family toxin of toxin-antitoxin system